METVEYSLNGINYTHRSFGKKIGIYGIYTVLFATGIIIPQLNKLICLSIVFLNVVRYSRKGKEGAILSTFVLPGDMLPTLSIIFFLFLELKNRKNLLKISKRFLISFSLLGTISFVCAARYGTYLNVIISLFYLLVIFLVVKNMQGIYNVDAIIYHLKRIIEMEFILSLVIVVQQRSINPGDINRGSFGDAHWFGFWLIVSLLSLWTYYRKYLGYTIKRAVSVNRSTIVLIIIMLALSEAKAITLCGLMAVLISIIFKWAGDKRIISITILGVVSVLYVTVYLIDTGAINGLIVRLIPYESIYIFREGFNQKYLYFRNTLLDELSGLRFLFGYGLGQYGSRISNLFIFKSVARRNNLINNFISSFMSEHAIPEYMRNISYYDTEFAAQIPWRSAILSYPYSSVIALLAETGIIGLVIYVVITTKLFKDSFNKVVFVFFFIACVFDIYFDDFSLMAYPLILLLNFKKSTKGKKRLFNAKKNTGLYIGTA